MRWFRVLLWLLPRRLRSSWVLLAIISFGILAAVTLMAVGAIYSRALAEGGLQHALAATSPEVLNAQVIVRNRPLGPADFQSLNATMKEIAEARLGHMLRDTQRFGWARPGFPLANTLLEAPVGRPFFLTGFEQHARVVEGRWPQVTTVLDDDDKVVGLEAVVGRKVASVTGLKVDAEVHLVPFKDDPSDRITLRVVGLAEPIDPRNEYWMNSVPTYFSVEQEVEGEALVPIYLPEEAFFGGLGARYPSLVGDYGWSLFLDTGGLSATAVKPTRDALTGLETDINKRFPRSLVTSGLESTLADYAKDLAHARVPLFLFISLVVVVILYFLVLVMGLLARYLGDEASLLRSRGASMPQMSGLLALGEGVVVLLAMVLGPFLALGIVRHLLLRTIYPAGEAGPPSVGLSADMFVMGAIGGLLSLGVLMASGVGLARLGRVEFLRGRARPPTVPFLHRYYVDLLVLAGVGLLWWQIQDRGGFIERDLLDNALEVDPSLLLGPVMVSLAAAFLLLRFLPTLVKAMAWVGERLAPAWVSFALARVARDPLPHGSLVIILMMAAALGIFGATFQSTLSRSQGDQARYDLGGDLVIAGRPFPAATPGLLASTPGVRSISPIGRQSVTILEGFSGSPSDLITVDPDTLPHTAWFRDDFAGKSLPALLRPLRQTQDSRQGILLPADAESVGIWAKVGPVNRGPFNLSPWVRLSDADGRHRSLLLGDLTSAGSSPDQGWTHLEAPLPVSNTIFKPPFSVVSIYISGGSTFRLSPGSISLDDLTVKGRGESTPADGVVVEGFEERGVWVPLPNAGVVADTLVRTPQAARSGLFGLTFSWQESVGGAPRGILIPPGPFPLPAIGGPEFYVGQELNIRSGRQNMLVVVRDVTDYFPTIHPTSRPFLVVARVDYMQYVQRIPGGSPKPLEELWVSLEEGADRGHTILSLKERLPRLSHIRDRDADVTLAQHNPLAGGGWNGLTILGMSALTVAVTLALVTYAAASVHTGRLDLAVVRALGLSRLQLLLSLALERVVVAIIGIAAGSALGIWLGRWVLGYLDITASGQPVVPPMIVTVHGGLMALVFLALVAALAVSILFAALAVRGLRVSDILRAGQ